MISGFVCVSFLESGRMQWKRNEKKRFSRKVAFITAGFELKPPPYPLVQLERSRDALEPHMSQETLDYHWGKHHKTYVENLNKQIVGTDLDGLSLEEVLLGADRSLAVARIDLLRSFDSLSCSYSARIALLRLLVMDSSLAVTRRRSFSRSRSDRSLAVLAVARLALLQLLGTYRYIALLDADRSLAVARIDLSRSLDSLSCSYSALIALLRLLAWNHEFFSESIQPGGGGKPSGYLLRLIERDFGSFNDLLERFKAAAASNFGSGWTWLAYKANRLDVANAINPLPKEEDKTLVIVKTPNAVNPLVCDYSPLLTIDTW
ncbi:hypothetical protein HID58_087334, partial [Brassica napus]